MKWHSFTLKAIWRTNRLIDAGDEARPRCQNCAEKQFECIYGTRVIFRESNLLGLTPKERRDLEQRTPNRYSDLRVSVLFLWLQKFGTGFGKHHPFGCLDDPANNRFSLKLSL
jgi:hypothetical protein